MLVAVSIRGETVSKRRKEWLLLTAITAQPLLTPCPARPRVEPAVSIMGSGNLGEERSSTMVA